MLNTFAVYAGIPAAVILVVAGLVLAGNDRARRAGRYRPGRTYDFQPVWFLAAPEPVVSGSSTAGQQERRQLDAGAVDDSAGARVLPGPVGGASDRW